MYHHCGRELVSANWDPTDVPTHDGQVSDTAIFDLVGAVSPMVVITANATAGRWLVRNMVPGPILG